MYWNANGWYGMTHEAGTAPPNQDRRRRANPTQKGVLTVVLGEVGVSVGEDGVGEDGEATDHRVT